MTRARQPSSDSGAEVPARELCVSQPPGVASESVSLVTCDWREGEVLTPGSPPIPVLWWEESRVWPRLLKSPPAPLVLKAEPFSLRPSSSGRGLSTPVPAAFSKDVPKAPHPDGGSRAGGFCRPIASLTGAWGSSPARLELTSWRGDVGF